MPGWRIVGDRNGSEIYIVTNSSTTFPDCPVGLKNGSTTDPQYFQLIHDPNFSIQCHSEEVTDHCENCQTVEVSAEKEISSYQLFRLGNYSLKGDFNGHPYYYMEHNYEHDDEQYNLTSYLYYRKDGKKIYA